VDNENALQNPKPLADHAGKRRLYADGYPACQADENNNDERLHVVFFLFGI
jgi:hypothetical protein